MSEYCVNPDALRYGWEDHPEVICDVARAYANSKPDGMILLALVVHVGEDDPNHKRMQEHGQWEQHAGTVLWIPAKMQQGGGRGYRVDQMLNRHHADDEWTDIKLQGGGGDE